MPMRCYALLAAEMRYDDYADADAVIDYDVMR